MDIKAGSTLKDVAIELLEQTLDAMRRDEIIPVFIREHISEHRDRRFEDHEFTDPGIWDKPGASALVVHYIKTPEPQLRDLA